MYFLFLDIENWIWIPYESDSSSSRIYRTGFCQEKEKNEIEIDFEMRKTKTTMGSNYSNETTTLFWGWFFMIFGSVFFIGFTFASVLSKLLAASANPVVSAIQNDRYYCFLVPLTLPILLVAVYFHWLSMKLFKHA